MMAKLTKDEQAILDDLTKRAAEPDAEDFEVEIYDTNAGRGMRLPFSQARAKAYEWFGIGEAPAEPSTSDAGEPPAGKSDPEPPQQGYFGRKSA